MLICVQIGTQPQVGVRIGQKSLAAASLSVSFQPGIDFGFHLQANLIVYSSLLCV